MPRKIIVRLGIKAASDMDVHFQELPLTPGSAAIEISSKKDSAGLLWTTKITAKLVRDVILLHEPCIIYVRTTDAYYIIGTPELPAQPTIKEEHLVAITLEYKSKTKPVEHKKVLSTAPYWE